jgi:hypothetical protein
MSYTCPTAKCQFSKVQLSELEAERFEKKCPKCRNLFIEKNRHRSIPSFEHQVKTDASKVVGRKQEIAELQKTIESTETGIIWIGGHGGIGKSFLFAKVFSLVKKLENSAETTTALYRFRAEDRECCNRQSFQRYLSNKIDAFDIHMPNFMGNQSDPPKPKSKLIVFVDGIDEIHSRDEKFVDEVLLANSRRGVLWVCCGKQFQEIEKSMKDAVIPFPDGLPPMKNDDISDLIRLGIKEVLPDKIDSSRIEEFIQSATAKASGSPLYAKHLIEDLKSGKKSLNEFTQTQLPEGIENYHRDLMSRVGSSDVEVMVAHILSSLAIAYEPLAYREILVFLEDRDLIEGNNASGLLDKGLEELASVLDQAPDPEGEVGYQFFHPSLKEHLLHSTNFKSSLQLARSAMGKLALGHSQPTELQNYLIRCGIRHLIESNYFEEAKNLLLDLDHLIKMYRQGIEWPEIVGYWERLGGEKEASAYLPMIKLIDTASSDEEVWEKLDFVCLLVEKAGWSELSLSISRTALDKIISLFPTQYSRISLVWLSLANKSKNFGDTNSSNEYQAMSRWSELRAEGKFVNHIDPDAFEKEVGIVHKRALEIEKEFKS